MDFLYVFILLFGFVDELYSADAQRQRALVGLAKSVHALNILPLDLCNIVDEYAGPSLLWQKIEPMQGSCWIRDLSKDNFAVAPRKSTAMVFSKSTGERVPFKALRVRQSTRQLGTNESRCWFAGRVESLGNNQLAYICSSVIKVVTFHESGRLSKQEFSHRNQDTILARCLPHQRSHGIVSRLLECNSICDSMYLQKDGLLIAASPDSDGNIKISAWRVGAVDEEKDDGGER